MLELVNNLSDLYDIKPSKAFRRQVELALRRGVDYGILVKTRNKYRFDPEASLMNSIKKAGGTKKTVNRGRVQRASMRRSQRQRVSVKKTRISGDHPSKSKSNVPRPSIPKPTVPPPPNFTPKPRNLSQEPFKVIRHRKSTGRK